MGKTSNYKYAPVMVPKQNQLRSDNSRVVEDQEGREGGSEPDNQMLGKQETGDSSSWNQGEIDVSPKNLAQFQEKHVIWLHLMCFFNSMLEAN